MLDLRRQYASIREDVLAAIERICASQVFVLGPEVEALEREVAVFTVARKLSAVHRVPTHFGSRLLLQGSSQATP